MEKKLIRLTESDLHRIIKESVNNILNEISYGVAKSAYDKMKDLGQYERANNLERTFKKVNDEDDAIYNLKNDSLELRGDMDSIQTRDNSIGRPATRYMRNKSGSINNQGVEYSRDRNHPKGEYDYYKPSHEGDVNGYMDRLTNNPKSARRFAKHANNFAGITKYDKNDFRR